MDVKQLIKRMSDSDVTIEEIATALQSSYVVLIANALMALARKLRQDPELCNDEQASMLSPLLENPSVRNVRLVNFYKTSFFVVYCLEDINTPKALQLAKDFLQTLSEDDRNSINRNRSGWELSVNRT